MKKRKIFITLFDKERLDELIAVAGAFGDYGRNDLNDLAKELERATSVDAAKVPKNVVTMNSKVQLRDSDSGDKFIYTLVFPKDADISAGALSVLAPIGTAILGYREDDEVDWEVPAGRRKIKIEKILYQPEASGDFHL